MGNRPQQEPPHHDDGSATRAWHPPRLIALSAAADSTAGTKPGGVESQLTKLLDVKYDPSAPA